MQSAHLDAIAYLFYFFFSFFFFGLKSLGSVWDQAPLQVDTAAISDDLFWELDELARIVDISYCVTYGGIGIQSPFQCLSWCREFADFELVTTWNTGPLFTDSCGYIAISHPPSAPRIIVAFRGTYSIANSIIDLSTAPQEYIPYPSAGDGCDDGGDGDYGQVHSDCPDCTVHSGFYTSWRVARLWIMPYIEEAIAQHPRYRLTVIGHSLGGAVAALAALDFSARGWKPRVTTFGEPRIGNGALARYLDRQFGHNATGGSGNSYFRRVTHIGDPVPLLPLDELGYRMHAGELFISQAKLPPSRHDFRVCHGDADPHCIVNNSLISHSDVSSAPPSVARVFATPRIPSVDPWLAQSLFAHRDYIWRLGLCVPKLISASAQQADVDDWLR